MAHMARTGPPGVLRTKRAAGAQSRSSSCGARARAASPRCDQPARRASRAAAARPTVPHTRPPTVPLHKPDRSAGADSVSLRAPRPTLPHTRPPTVPLHPYASAAPTRTNTRSRPPPPPLPTLPPTRPPTVPTRVRLPPPPFLLFPLRVPLPYQHASGSSPSPRVGTRGRVAAAARRSGVTACGARRRRAARRARWCRASSQRPSAAPCAAPPWQRCSGAAQASVRRRPPSHPLARTHTPAPRGEWGLTPPPPPPRPSY